MTSLVENRMIGAIGFKSNEANNAKNQSTADIKWVIIA
ncbi:hypothetical protein H1R20_g15415, partial [Candolleomyces eurysporus]